MKVQVLNTTKDPFVHDLNIADETKLSDFVAQYVGENPPNILVNGKSQAPDYVIKSGDLVVISKMSGKIDSGC